MIGVEAFQAAFAPHADKFILIGGMATALQADDLGTAFRATKDFDVVLIVEALDTGFFVDFWKFIQAGGYSFEKARGEKQFYRFSRPTATGVPYQIELFARKPDIIQLPKDAKITPLPAGDEASSLSAILLDEAYYNCLLQGRTLSHGIPVLGPG